MSLKKYQGNSSLDGEDYGHPPFTERTANKSLLPPLNSPFQRKNLFDSPKRSGILLFQPNQSDKNSPSTKKKEKNSSLTPRKNPLIKESYHLQDKFILKSKKDPLPKSVSADPIESSKSFSQSQEPQQGSSQKPISIIEDFQFEHLRTQKKHKGEENSLDETPRQHRLENSQDEDIFRLTRNKNSLPAINQSFLQPAAPNDFNNFLKMERVRNSLNMELQDSFKVLYRDAIQSYTGPDAYTFSAAKTNELQQRLVQFHSIEHKRNKRFYKINEFSVNAVAPRELSRPKNISLKLNLVLKDIQATSRTKRIEKPVKENLINIIPDEDYGYDPTVREAAFERYYKKVEPANLKTKNREYLVKLEKINKVKEQIKQKKLLSDLDSKSIEELRVRNNANLEKFRNDKFARLRARTKAVKDKETEQENQMDAMLQDFRTKFEI